MDLEVTVRARGRYWNGGAIARVPDPMAKAFEPLKTTDEPLMALLAGDAVAGSYEVREVMNIREDAAEYLSKKIAHMLLGEMRKHDTRNGYAKKEN